MGSEGSGLLDSLAATHRGNVITVNVTPLSAAERRNACTTVGKHASVKHASLKGETVVCTVTATRSELAAGETPESIAKGLKGKLAATIRDEINRDRRRRPPSRDSQPTRERANEPKQDRRRDTKSWPQRRSPAGCTR